MPDQTIDIVEFSRFPFGRYPSHGPFNGQRFRQERLLPAIRGGSRVIVDLSGARGLSPSFLEEAFGGLVREGLTPDYILDHLEVRDAQEGAVVEKVLRYVREAGARAHQ